MEKTEVFPPKDIADGVASMVTCPHHITNGELFITPIGQSRQRPPPGRPSTGLGEPGVRRR
ncbi:hypothetical protein [Pseudofrankia sp. BMG5.37]|uniref:hypothetical protein n=1 Tax=Pseudofrankia sp. BMG5.37 TaxID=3050035 RepID=UPI002893941A|nr:hypothetical protein [Pseudofrankia sp. BMG5.37]MDT3446829.1 hypothetical protein [Pseudofrankia sp. BMG5.37]